VFVDDQASLAAVQALQLSLIAIVGVVMSDVLF
jgi:hypothetical protein